MANTPYIKTRIKHKIDTLQNWQASTLKLEAGELAIATMETGELFLNPVTNKEEPKIELLLKVGTGGKTFAEEEFVAAKAADVYAWAKTANIKDVEVTVAVDDDTTNTLTLEDWLKDYLTSVEQINESLDANDRAIQGVSALVGNTAVSAQITAALAGLTGQVTTSDNTELADDLLVVDSISQENGVVTATRKKLPKATADSFGVVTLPSSIATTTSADAAARFVDVFSGDNSLKKQLESLTSTVDGISNATANGMRFIGRTTAAAASMGDGNTRTSLPVVKPGSAAPVTMSTNATDINLKLIPGDVVICGTGANANAAREFVFDGYNWFELGDTSRLTTLETWKNGLDYADTAVAHKVVTEVDQVAGKIEVKRARLAADDITMISNDTAADPETVKDAVDNLDSRINSVETNYLKVNTEGTTQQLQWVIGAEIKEIIFDCGTSVE